ncbi:segregation/condensation protein A [Eubacteriales bacterium OttesenSCG-928-K08]|nr:segregation/condensation protein A [Eubacteriales bacterium OttesenSCG-928-K08]
MNYLVHINQFDGPLDLLLHLIESAELDIKDIFISEITAQYLNYMEQLNDLNMDTASEFLTMAATLLYIKSRQLLPRPPQEQQDEEDPEALLIRQLHEYKLFKEAGEQLNQLQSEARGMFTRLPEEITLPQQEISLSEATAAELYQAFFTLLHAAPEEKPENPLHQVRPDSFTVRAQINKIRFALLEKKELRFDELFDGYSSRIEIIVTFMAVLEMVARSEIFVRQSEPFAPMRLLAHQIGRDDSNADYMDEIME